MRQMQQALHDAQRQLCRHFPFRGASTVGLVSVKDNGSHISLLPLLKSGLTVAQVEQYAKDEVWEHYLWDKVRIS